MSNGLVVDEKEFAKLPVPEKFNCLYGNQKETIRLVRGFRFHQKVQYILISLIIAGVGILFKIQLNLGG